MINPQIKLVDSVLEVKALGAIADISADLSLESTKTIAELLDDKKETEQEEEREQENIK
jgi:hypothetical protein